jgi:hypothetical protein
MNTENYISILRVLYKDARDAVLVSESQMLLKVATYAYLNRQGTLRALAPAENGMLDELDSDFEWVTAMQTTRDQAIADIEKAKDDNAAQAVIDSIVWPVR